MKEYKVVKANKGLVAYKFENLEEVLNQYAREGWCLKNINESSSILIFERDKNR